MSEAVPVAAAEMAAAGFSRVALGLEYKGARYRGFQRQGGKVASIQGCLEDALSKVAGGAPVTIHCAGRTDASVHSSGQVVHFDTTVERSLHAWIMGANMNLPKDISVTWAKIMPAHFHARFSAVARRYRYVIYNDPIRPAHMAEEVTWNHRPLDVARMREAAAHLVGTHDFTSFRAVQCQAKSPVKTVHHLEVIEHGCFIVIDVRAADGEALYTLSGVTTAGALKPISSDVANWTLRVAPALDGAALADHVGEVVQGLGQVAAGLALDRGDEGGGAAHVRARACDAAGSRGIGGRRAPCAREGGLDEPQ